MRRRIARRARHGAMRGPAPCAPGGASHPGARTPSGVPAPIGQPRHAHTVSRQRTARQPQHQRQHIQVACTLSGHLAWSSDRWTGPDTTPGQRMMRTHRQMRARRRMWGSGLTWRPATLGRVARRSQRLPNTIGPSGHSCRIRTEPVHMTGFGDHAPADVRSCQKPAVCRQPGRRFHAPERLRPARTLDPFDTSPRVETARSSRSGRIARNVRITESPERSEPLRRPGDRIASRRDGRLLSKAPEEPLLPRDHDIC